MALRDGNHGVEDRAGPLFIDDGEIELGAAGTRRLLVGAADLAREKTAGEWAPNEQPGLGFVEEGNEFAFEMAPGDRVVGLQSIEAREILEFRNGESPGDLPRLPVRDADVTNLTPRDERVEGAERLLDGGDRIVRVDLIQIDVVGLEATETRFHSIHEVPPESAPIVALRTDTGVHLGLDNNVLAGAAQVLQRLPESLLAFPVRVDVRRIEEVDASIDGALDQLVGFLLIDATDDFIDALGATERHGAEAEAGNREP